MDHGRIGAGVRRALLAAVASGALVAACGAASSPSPAPATTVNVTLQEFAVLPDVASVPAGTVTFVATNTGPEDEHELVVIKTDLGPSDLPVDADKKVLEDGAGIEFIGEIEGIAVDGTDQADFVLEPGKYVLICNILQTEPDGSLESHYAVGMRTPFEVTAP